MCLNGFLMPLQGSLLCGPHGEEDVMEVFILLLILASVVVNGSLKAFACIPSVGGHLKLICDPTRWWGGALKLEHTSPQEVPRFSVVWP